MKNGSKDRLTRRLVVSNSWKDISRLGGMHLNLLSESLAAYVTTNISGLELQDNQSNCYDGERFVTESRTLLRHCYVELFN